MDDKEFDISQNLRPLVDNVVSFLCTSNKNIGPLNQVDKTKLQENNINAEQELKIDNSIVQIAWNELCARLGVDKDDPIRKESPITFVSKEDEVKIRSWVLSRYIKSEHDGYPLNPLLKNYFDAKTELEDLSRVIEDSGEYSRQTSHVAYNPFGQGDWYRFLDGLPTYTPQLGQTRDEIPEPIFILPLEHEPVLEVEESPLTEMLKSSGLRGISAQFFIIVLDEDKNKKIVDEIKKSPKLLKLFLAEEIALKQENLLHSLRAKINKISREL